MKHTAKYHVHYHYTDRNFRLKLFYIAKYMQETALAAFDRLEAPRQELIDRGLAFILTKLSFRFDGEVKKFDEITVETWALPFKSITFVRNYRVRNETTGECAIRASSSWALININEKSIVRPDTLSANYTAMTDDEDIGFQPVRKIISMPADDVLFNDSNLLFQKEILYSDIDENLHMNNTIYLDIIENALWKVAGGVFSGKLRALDLSYNSGAAEGERLTVWGMREDADNGTEIYVKGMIGSINCFDAKALYGYHSDAQTGLG